MHTDTPRAFAELLRRHRRAAGLTQEDLAERAGLSLRAVSDLERGVKTRPHRDTVALLAAALQLSPQDRAAFEAARRHGAAASPLSQAGPLPHPAALPPLVGRTRELALLERHLAGHGPPLLLLAGEPGIGKSRLLHEAARRGVSAGWTVLMGGCQRRSGQEPFAPLPEALDGYIMRRSPAELRPDLRGCAWLVRLLPELAMGPIEPLPGWTLSPEQERRLMDKAMGRFLANVAGPAGTLLLLDDLQWAGADALDLLTTLVRSSEVPTLRVIGAYRDTEVQPHDALAVALGDLAHAGLAQQCSLAPLAAEEANNVLDALLEGRAKEEADAAVRARVVERAGGVPFFLVSYAQGLRQAPHPAEAAVPWDLAQGVRQRVAAVPTAARELLNMAALIGRVVPYALLVGAATCAEPDVLVAVEAASRARLLEQEGPDAYRFAHDVIHEVIEADLSPARRTVLHRQIAEALEADHGAHPADVLAYHYMRAGVPDKAMHYLEQAGDQARAQHAHAAAASYYQELVTHLERAGRRPQAANVREKLGAVLDTAGQYDAALAVLEQAVTMYQGTGDREGLCRVLAALGHVHFHRGTPEEGLQRLQPVLAALAPADASHGTAALYVAVAALCSICGRYAELLAAADRALTLARAVGDERIVVAALFDRGAALTELGRRAEALPVLEEASRLAEAHGDLDTACQALNLAGCVHEDLGAFATAQCYTERALAAAEQWGEPSSIAYLTVRRGTGAYLSGEWARARADFEHALALCRQMGPSFASPFPLLDLGRLCLAEGAWEEAVAYLEESCAISIRSGNLNPLRWAQVELAEHDLLMGRPEAARARLEPLLDRPGLEEGQVIFLLPPLAQAHLELGAVEQAAALVGQCVQRARAQPNQRALVGALRVQALVLIRQGDWAAAERAVEEGLALARAMPYPYAEARLLYVCGLLQSARGEPGPARGHLEAALALFQRLGARKDTERTENLIEQLGPPSAAAP